MLDEAIEYLKQLQLQIQRRKEETEEEGRREGQKRQRNPKEEKNCSTSQIQGYVCWNQFWAESRIHSFYDVAANPLDKQVSISKSDKRRQLMLEGAVGSSIQGDRG
ncbi:hypothetical protein ABKV19_025076 [Rosa sericea]